jgi:hypothetical protein
MLKIVVYKLSILVIKRAWNLSRVKMLVLLSFTLFPLSSTLERIESLDLRIRGYIGRVVGALS